MSIRKIGIVGCGVMGSGIGLLCALKNYSVVVSEKNETRLKEGFDSIRSELSKLSKTGNISDSDGAAVLDRIEGTCDFNHFSTCDLVIEAVTENLALKKEIFRKLDSICPAETILTSNTSVLPVIEMARVTSRPERVLGAHFLTPPHIIPLLEIVRTLKTDTATLETVAAFGDRLGKQVVISSDSPGFIVNRILTSILYNSVRLLEEGVGTKEDIETAVKSGLGLPMGPFKLMDLIGLDTLVLGAEALFYELNDPQYACPLIIRRMVSAGWLGRKSGRGFYDYEPKQ